VTEMLLGNVAETVSDEEIGEFLTRYGFPPFSAIRREPGTGDRPAAIVVFENETADSLRVLQSRIHNIFWKDHTITALLIPQRSEPF